jgi:hypothetical protein
MARHAILAVLLVLAACGKDEGKQLTAARSWSATAMLVAGHWVQGEVPSAYAREALHKAAMQLADGPFPEAGARVAELEAGVAREDRAAVKKRLEELAQ